MSDSSGDLDHFTTASFGAAVTTGSDYAHDALSNPRDGTILSVIAAFARSVERQIEKDPDRDFSTLMERALRDSEGALAQTPEQLDVLKKAGVVDAGAKGFVALVDGMTVFIRDGRIVDEPDLSLINIDEPIVTAGGAHESAYRYCTECIVTGNGIDRRKLREALAELGDSLVLAGTKRKAKIHIHVDEPERVF